MDVVTQSVVEVYANRDKVNGLKMVYEPEYLRFFQARFELVGVRLMETEGELCEVGA